MFCTTIFLSFHPVCTVLYMLPATSWYLHYYTLSVNFSFFIKAFVHCIWVSHLLLIFSEFCHNYCFLSPISPMFNIEMEDFVIIVTFLGSDDISNYELFVWCVFMLFCCCWNDSLKRHYFHVTSDCSSVVPIMYLIYCGQYLVTVTLTVFFLDRVCCNCGLFVIVLVFILTWMGWTMKQVMQVKFNESILH